MELQEKHQLGEIKLQLLLPGNRQSSEARPRSCLSRKAAYLRSPAETYENRWVNARPWAQKEAQIFMLAVGNLETCDYVTYAWLRQSSACPLRVESFS